MRTRWDPQTVLAQLARGEADCATEPMRIDRHGRWYHEGRPIGRAELVRLFATALYRGPDGRYWLLTPFERVPVEVEDAPLLVVGSRHEGEGRGRRIWLRTNLGDELPLDPAHPLALERRDGTGPVPYVELERGLRARLARPVYYELAEIALEDAGDGLPGVWSFGCFFPLTEPGP